MWLRQERHHVLGKRRHRSIGERIAQERSRGKAVSWLVYGSGLGSAFYSVFPTMREVPMATPVVGLLLTLRGLLIGVLPDPLLKRLGLHHRQLRTLINAIEDRLYLMRQRLKLACLVHEGLFSRMRNGRRLRLVEQPQTVQPCANFPHFFTLLSPDDFPCMGGDALTAC